MRQGQGKNSPHKADQHVNPPRQGVNFLQSQGMPRPVVIACYRLHTLAETQDEHHAETAKGVRQAVCTHGKVAAETQQLLVEQGHHRRSRDVHQERTHANKQNVFEDIAFRLPSMTTEPNERTPLQEMNNREDSRACHGDGGRPSRTCDAPVQSIDEQRIEANVEHCATRHDPHRLLRIARGTHQAGEVERQGGHEHAGKHDVHIFPCIADGLRRGSKSSQDTVHEDIAPCNEEETENEGQQQAVAQDFLRPVVVFLA